MTGSYGALLDALRGVRWPARRAVGAALPGAHRSRQRGTAGEFTEYRLYRQGDDPKQLDWKLLARSDRAFVRLTDDRALLPTLLVLDGSASMAFPDAAHLTPGVPDKFTAAKLLAVGLGAVAHASGDPVGAIATGSGGVYRLAPRTRRGTVTELARTLDAVVPGGTGDIAPLLATLSSSCRAVVISDLLGDLDALLRTASQLVAAGGIVECIHVVAAEELAPAGAPRTVRDPEQPETERVFDRASLTAYRASFDAFRADAARRWRASGAGYTEVTTDAAMPRVVRQIVSTVQ